MSAGVSGIRGGQPSTTQPSAGPWLSPKVVTRKRWPKVLWDMGRPPKPERAHALAAKPRAGQTEGAAVQAAQVSPIRRAKPTSAEATLVPAVAAVTRRPWRAKLRRPPHAHARHGERRGRRSTRCWRACSRPSSRSSAARGGRSRRHGCRRAPSTPAPTGDAVADIDAADLHDAVLVEMRLQGGERR